MKGVYQVSLPKKSKPPGISIGAARLRQAREFLVLHPEMSKTQASAATGISEATIGRARRDLVAEGTLQPARNAPVRPEPLPEATQPPEATAPEDSPPPAPAPAPKKGSGTLLDHAALLQLAQMVDEAIESGDDETIQKKLSKQALVFAFRADLHPDTRMSASQMYYKLKDMAKAKDLGPGRPKTFALALVRATECVRAWGPELTMAAIHEAFTVKEATSDADQPAQQQQDEAPAPRAQAVEPSLPQPTPIEAPGAPNNDHKDPANPW